MPNIFKVDAGIELPLENLPRVVNFVNGKLEPPFTDLGKKITELFLDKYKIPSILFKFLKCTPSKNGDKLVAFMKCDNHKKEIRFVCLVKDVTLEKSVWFTIKKSVACLCDIRYNDLLKSSADLAAIVDEEDDISISSLNSVESNAWRRERRTKRAYSEIPIGSSGTYNNNLYGDRTPLKYRILEMRVNAIENRVNAIEKRVNANEKELRDLENYVGYKRVALPVQPPFLHPNHTSTRDQRASTPMVERATGTMGMSTMNDVVAPPNETADVSKEMMEKNPKNPQL